MQDLITYKTLPIWNAQTLPDSFRQRHNTKAGTWAQLTILSGTLELAFLEENGTVIETYTFSTDRQPPLVEPQHWHRIANVSDDLTCQLAFLCEPETYYHHKHGLTATHSNVVAAAKIVPPGKALDLGCGGGRNALYLNLKGFTVTGWDKHASSIAALNEIIRQENLSGIEACEQDLNTHQFTGKYDFILSTVVMMFLDAQQIPRIIQNMRQSTVPDGYNLIVCAMSTEDYPCPLPFSFTFRSGELSQYYADWSIVEYNEEVGRLHKTDAQGNPIQMRFATLLAKRPGGN